jgi:hypothetical protein
MKNMNHHRIDVGKRKYNAALKKMTKEECWINSSLAMIMMGYTIYTQEYNYMVNVLSE